MGNELFSQGVSIDTSSFVTKFNEAETDNNVVIGEVVYMKSNGHIDKAIANTSATSNVVGLVSENKLAGVSCKYINDAEISLADWTAIIGSANLTSGVVYYLSPSNAGQLTSTAPTTVGDFVCRIGKALSVTTLAIEIEASILL